MKPNYGQLSADGINATVAKSEPRFNYTGHGTEGRLYRQNENLGIKEIAANVRKALKGKYPDCTFSVTISRYSGGQSLSISLMAAPFDVFTDAVDEYTKKSQHDQVNHYYIGESNRYTEKAKEVLLFANRAANDYNFDDSDGMIDYFHTNFYLHLNIGKWDKPFIRTN